jgi:hypothetical protein
VRDGVFDFLDILFGPGRAVVNVAADGRSHAVADGGIDRRARSRRDSGVSVITALSDFPGSGGAVGYKFPRSRHFENRVRNRTHNAFLHGIRC